MRERDTVGVRDPPSVPSAGPERTCCSPRVLTARGPGRRCPGRRTAPADGCRPAPSGALDWRIDFTKPVLLPGTVATSFTREKQDRGAGVGGGLVEVMGWSAERQRPHFTGWVRAE